MNVKIHPGKIKYYTYPETQKVTAVLINTKYDLCDFVGMFDESLELHGSYAGTATCDASDKFSVETGKAIARRKAIYKYRSHMYRAYKNYMDKQVKALAAIDLKLSDDFDYSANKYVEIMKESGANV